MNKFPLWLNTLVLAVLLAGCLFALPNLYGSVDAVQIADNNGVAYDEPLNDSGRPTIVKPISPRRWLRSCRSGYAISA